MRVDNLPSSQLLLRAREAAALAGVSLRTWRSWDAAGRVPAPVRIGRTTRWRRHELQQWVVAGCPGRHVWAQAAAEKE